MTEQTPSLILEIPTVDNFLATAKRFYNRNTTTQPINPAKSGDYLTDNPSTAAGVKNFYETAVAAGNIEGIIAVYNYYLNPTIYKNS